LKHIYAQLIDDQTGVTICEASTRTKGVREQVANKGGNIGAAKTVGAILAEKAKSKNVQCICFDRNGYRFHGRVKALADAAREAGLKF
jgi:large subunit ribosomal protein L18